MSSRMFNKTYSKSINRNKLFPLKHYRHKLEVSKRRRSKVCEKPNNHQNLLLQEVEREAENQETLKRSFVECFADL